MGGGVPWGGRRWEIDGGEGMPRGRVAREEREGVGVRREKKFPKKETPQKKTEIPQKGNFPKYPSNFR